MLFKTTLPERVLSSRSSNPAISGIRGFIDARMLIQMKSEENYHHDGWIIDARIAPSPFFHSRQMPPSLVVVHSIAIPPFFPGHQDVLDLFSGTLDLDKDAYYKTLKGVRVSSHFVIDRMGVLYQCVNLNDVAWHCGYSIFEGERACNEFSIGIELIGHDFEPFTEDQYKAISLLCARLIIDWDTLSAERIVGHRDISPGRKTDPGVFDWKLFFGYLHQQLAGIRRSD